MHYYSNNWINFLMDLCKSFVVKPQFKHHSVCIQLLYDPTVKIWAFIKCVAWCFGFFFFFTIDRLRENTYFLVDAFNSQNQQSIRQVCMVVTRAGPAYGEESTFQTCDRAGNAISQESTNSQWGKSHNQTVLQI